MIRGNHYVYVIFRLDGSPCYIGKGKGDRWLRHFKRSSNIRLKRIIRLAGGALPIIKIRDNLTNKEACNIESALIAAIGRGRNGPLVNFTDGGEGTVGYRWPPKSRMKYRAYWNSEAGLSRRARQSQSAKNQMAPGSDQIKNLIKRSVGNQYGVGRTHTATARAIFSATASLTNKTRETKLETRNKRSIRMKALWAERRDDLIARQKKWAADHIDQFRENTPQRGDDGRFMQS